MSEIVLNNFQIKVGDKVRCIKNDPMDDHCGIAEHLRWHIGDEFYVWKVETLPWGTFLHDGQGHNLNIKRAELVNNKVKI